MCTKFDDNWIETMTFRSETKFWRTVIWLLWDPYSSFLDIIWHFTRPTFVLHTRIYTYIESFQPRDWWRSMTHRSLGLFVQEWQPKICLAGYDILFAFFIAEVKSKKYKQIKLFTILLLKYFIEYFCKTIHI